MKHLLTGVLLLLAWTANVHAANPRAEIVTNQGTIVIELDPEKAPMSVENFLTYAQAGFYEGTIFHRVIKDFMIQGGGFTKDMERKPTNPPIENESGNGLINLRGTVALARTNDLNSATSQFFINTKDNDFLKGYAVFGKVVQGMEVVDKIQTVETTDMGGMKNVPSKAISIDKVVIKNAPAKSPVATEKEDKKAAEAKKATEDKKLADEKKEADEKKLADEKKSAEDKKVAEAEAKKATDEKKLADEKKAAEDKKVAEAEAKKMADEKKLADEKKAAEDKKVAEAKKTEVSAKSETATGAPVVKENPIKDFPMDKAVKAPDAPTKPDKPEPVSN